MAIAIRSETTGTGTGSISDVLAVTKPSSVQDGDYLVVILGANDDAPDVAAPGDWTQGDRVEGTSGNDLQIGIWYKKITNAAGEPSSYNFTVGFQDFTAYWIGALSGVDPTTPEDETMSGNAVYRTNDTSPDAASITTATPGAFVLAGWYSAGQVGGGTTLPGGSWASRADDVDPGGNNVLNVVSQTFASAGATGAVEITGVGASVETGAGQWAFRPSGVSVNVSDSITVTESVNRTLVHNTGVVSDSINVTESVNVALVHCASVSDSITVTENRKQEMLSFISVSDTITVTDVVRYYQDTVNVVDQVTPTLVSLVTKSDSVTVTESVQLLIPELFVNVSDSITVTDVVRYYQDTVAVVDRLTSLLVSDVNVSDSITVSESVVLTQSFDASASDTITVSENTLVYFEFNVSVSDSITVTEAVSVSRVNADDLSISVSDGVTVSENTVVELGTTTSVSESITVNEAIQLELPINLSVSDSITVTESVSLALSTEITVSDSITVSENIVVYLNSDARLTDNITVSESIALELTIARSVSDTITVSESLAVYLNINLNVSDNVTLTEAVAVFSPQLAPIQVSDTISVTENKVVAIQDGTLDLAVSDTVTLTEALNFEKDDGSPTTPVVWLEFYGGRF